MIKKNNKELLEEEPLEFFKECDLFLMNYINNSKRIKGKKTNIFKLFSIGYIKTYLYTFISMTNNVNSKFKELEIIIKETTD